MIAVYSLDGARFAEHNPGSALKPRIPAFGLHPGYHYAMMPYGSLPS
jgi:hypothetical protein